MISSSKDSNSYQNSPKIKKWIILFSLCLNSISSVFLFNAFSPIWSLVAIYYRTDDYNLNWFSNCYFLLPIVLTLFLNPIILKYYGWTQIISCITTSIGLWTIYLAKRNYNLGLLGFIFIGLGQSLYFHVPLHLSKLWFEPNERIISTFIGQYSSNLGLLLGYLVSAIYFYNEIDQNQFNQKFPNILFFNAILSTLSVPLSIFTFQKPNDIKNKIILRDSIWKSIKIVCSKQESLFDILSVSACNNSNYYKLLVMVGVILLFLVFNNYSCYIMIIIIMIGQRQIPNLIYKLTQRQLLLLSVNFYLNITLNQTIVSIFKLVKLQLHFLVCNKYNFETIPFNYKNKPDKDYNQAMIN